VTCFCLLIGKPFTHSVLKTCLLLRFNSGVIAACASVRLQMNNVRLDGSLWLLFLDGRV